MTGYGNDAPHTRAFSSSPNALTCKNLSDPHTIFLTLQARKEWRCSLLIPETPMLVAKLYPGPDTVWATTLESEGSGKLPYPSGYLGAHPQLASQRAWPLHTIPAIPTHHCWFAGAWGPEPASHCTLVEGLS